MKYFLSYSLVFALGITSAIAAPKNDVGETSALEKAFLEGKATGHLGVYGQLKNLKGGVQATNTKGEAKKLSGYVSPSASVVYESAPITFVSLGMGAWANTSLWESVEGDYDGAYGNEMGEIENNSTLHQIYAKIQHPGYGYVQIGRQEIDMEWLTDYIQGVTLYASPIENLDIVAVWAGKQATVGYDSVSPQFDDMNKKEGVYGLSIAYTLMDFFTINPYYFYANGVVQIPGIKLIANVDAGSLLGSRTTLQYAQGVPGDELKQVIEKGYYANIEQVFSLHTIGVNLGVGYIQTDKDNGAELVAIYGDQTPIEEGNHILMPNAKTFYGFAEYSVMEDLIISALYASTDFSHGGNEKGKEQEVDIKLSYTFLKNFSSEIIYAAVSNKDKAESYDVFKLLFAYQF